ncbi:hypothetical protein LWI29_027225 [Acer saccharum]|uniref:Uncharacterized protein n=1 Tax=Acer saccharum TaxID=4024 RepID=A0AA39RRI3_ACESA|nr:hypothetical protein LWI29_027225 [Acer saccharum]
MSVGSGSQNQGECVRNRDYSRRMAKLNAAQFIFERGIYLDELKHTSVPEIVLQRRWGDFVKAPRMSNATVVKELYASMDSEKVKKGGQSCGFTASNLMKPALAKALHGTEDDRWDIKHELKQSQLPHLLAFWNIFLAHSLMPALHRTTLGED